MIRIKYDKEVDVVYIQFSEKQVAESDKDKPGIILDYDDEGKLSESKFWRHQKRWDNQMGLSMRLHNAFYSGFQFMSQGFTRSEALFL